MSDQNEAAGQLGEDQQQRSDQVRQVLRDFPSEAEKVRLVQRVLSDNERTDMEAVKIHGAQFLRCLSVIAGHRAIKFPTHAMRRAEQAVQEAVFWAVHDITGPQLGMGVDPAKPGTDKTVLSAYAPLHGGWEHFAAFSVRPDLVADMYGAHKEAFAEVDSAGDDAPDDCGCGDKGSLDELMLDVNEAYQDLLDAVREVQDRLQDILAGGHHWIRVDKFSSRSGALTRAEVDLHAMRAEIARAVGDIEHFEKQQMAEAEAAAEKLHSMAQTDAKLASEAVNSLIRQHAEKSAAHMESQIKHGLNPTGHVVNNALGQADLGQVDPASWFDRGEPGVPAAQPWQKEALANIEGHQFQPIGAVFFHKGAPSDVVDLMRDVLDFMKNGYAHRLSSAVLGELNGRAKLVADGLRVRWTPETLMREALHLRRALDKAKVQHDHHDQPEPPAATPAGRVAAGLVVRPEEAPSEGPANAEADSPTAADHSEEQLGLVQGERFETGELRPWAATKAQLMETIQRAADLNLGQFALEFQRHLRAGGQLRVHLNVEKVGGSSNE